MAQRMAFRDAVVIAVFVCLLRIVQCGVIPDKETHLLLETGERTFSADADSFRIESEAIRRVPSTGAQSTLDDNHSLAVQDAFRSVSALDSSHTVVRVRSPTTSLRPVVADVVLVNQPVKTNLKLDDKSPAVKNEHSEEESIGIATNEEKADTAKVSIPIAIISPVPPTPVDTGEVDLVVSGGKPSLNVPTVGVSDIAVSNIHPIKHPKFSNLYLPGLVQILTHLVEELDKKEQVEHLTDPLPEKVPVAPSGESGEPTTVISGSPVAVVQVIPQSGSSFIVEVAPARASNDKDVTVVNVSQKKTYVQLNKHADDLLEEFQNDQPVVQHKVPVVSEESGPMTMDISFAPENTESQDDSSEILTSTEIIRKNPSTEQVANKSVTTLKIFLNDAIVYYPTLYFSDAWNKKPGDESGYLGYREGMSPSLKDHVDAQEESGFKSTEEEVENLDKVEYQSLKDNGFLLSDTRSEGALNVPRRKPSHALIQLVKLRFAVSADAKRSGLSKFQGYSDKVLADLISTSFLTGTQQLEVILSNVIKQKEIRSITTRRRAEQVLIDLQTKQSVLSKALEGISALKYD